MAIVLISVSDVDVARHILRCTIRNTICRMGGGRRVKDEVTYAAYRNLRRGGGGEGG